MSDSFCGHILHATETRQLNSYNSAFIIMLIIQYDSPSHNHNILHCCLCCSCCALKRSSLQYYNEALYCSATQPIHLMQDKYTYYIYVYIYIYIKKILQLTVSEKKAVSGCTSKLVRIQLCAGHILSITTR